MTKVMVLSRIVMIVARRGYFFEKREADREEIVSVLPIRMNCEAIFDQHYQ
ncbi:MAG: hypothetical protein LAT80_15250 [Balneolaceae bacterium]|nr:hypothetical protein [Balneolaceae bacterium]